MYFKYIAVVAAIAATLVGTAAITPTDSAFATKYDKNQATSQANACGNGEFPFNVGCQNVNSQIQGDENSVALGAEQVFPPLQLVPAIED